ncbi:hypothetical protein CEUSTIGMA_g2719.t1 [Chlamydomonas eustigma]|uniref:Mannose-P-dolichol utilization defect 1 protein homolog n=1 Tax=Chlamydomonas eustigma TaxID=1157962 RepID=A0A250WWR5_9CHLO|nr:hypothetical protein CEUSTIGMA_g2719.t1 [Chlamydomonas eustigma]|eukprot:GAX75274.1 hypothetical protein CEUSTIGMA_g2719.t1 [Chlamydomonas eustigma]
MVPINLDNNGILICYRKPSSAMQAYWHSRPPLLGSTSKQIRPLDQQRCQKIRCFSFSHKLQVSPGPLKQLCLVTQPYRKGPSSSVAAHCTSGVTVSLTVQPEAVISHVTATAGWSEVLAVVIGYLVLAGACFRSIPQIVRMLKEKSAEGLSLTSNVSELLSYTVHIVYNVKQGYPFNTFGDSVPLWFQDVLIVWLILKHQSVPVPMVLGGMLVFAGICCWLASPYATLEMLNLLQSSNILVGIFGMKLPQIILNIRRGDSGVLSPTTCLLNVAGNLARVYTTCILTQDRLLLAGILIQGVLNLILLLQALATEKKFNANSSKLSTS